MLRQWRSNGKIYTRQIQKKKKIETNEQLVFSLILSNYNYNWLERVDEVSKIIIIKSNNL